MTCLIGEVQITEAVSVRDVMAGRLELAVDGGVTVYGERAEAGDLLYREDVRYLRDTLSEWPEEASTAGWLREQVLAYYVEAGWSDEPIGEGR